MPAPDSRPSFKPQRQQGHSAKISMTLMLNGSALSIAQLGPDFLLLRETADHQPAEATIVMNVDGDERSWQVVLPAGITAGSERVSIAEAQSCLSGRMESTMPSLTERQSPDTRTLEINGDNRPCG